MENQSEDVESPHAQDPTPQRDSGSNAPQVRAPTPLSERGRDSQLDMQTIKALGSEGMNVEEFLVDIFESKMKSSCALL